MQVQATGEIVSTKRKFNLSGAPLIESRLYITSASRRCITDGAWRRPSAS